MKKLKIIVMILISIACILLFKNVSYGIGESQISADLGYLENNPDRYCGDHDAHMNHGEYHTYNLVSHVRIDGYYAINDEGKRVGGQGTHIGNLNIAMYSILKGDYTGQTGYGVLHNNTTTQLVLWGFLNTWLDGIEGVTTGVRNELGLDPRLGTGLDNVSKLYKESALAQTAFDRVMQIALSGNAPGGVVDIYMYVTGGGTTAYQHIYEVDFPDIAEGTSLKIDKVDEENGEYLPNVSFKLYCEGMGWLKRATGTSGNGASKVWDYTSSEGEAEIFSTGGYSSIEISGEGFRSGNYVIKEISNPNAGYEKNVGLCFLRTVNKDQANQIVITNKKEREEIPTPEVGEGKGKVTIEGTVWEDDFAGKGNNTDSLYGGGDEPVKDVTVKWYTASGKLIETTKTDGSGKYKMEYISQYENIIERVEPFEYNDEVLEELTNSYVVFEYNGVKYTTVATSSTEENGSRGKENENQRNAVDDIFYEVTKDTVQKSGATLTIEKNSLGDNQVKDDEKFVVSASTKEVINNLLGTDDHDQHNEKGIYGHYDLNNKKQPYAYGPGANVGSSIYREENGEEYVDWCIQEPNQGEVSNRVLEGQSSDGTFADWQQKITVPSTVAVSNNTNSDNTNSNTDDNAKHQIATFKYSKVKSQIECKLKGESEEHYRPTDNQDDPETFDYRTVNTLEEHTVKIYCGAPKKVWDAVISKNPESLGAALNVSIDTNKTDDSGNHESWSVTQTQDMVIKAYEHSVGAQEKVETDFHIKNVNLGLVRRESPDLALKSDINNVVVTMKGQRYTYYYGHRGIQNISAPQVSFSDDGKVYTRPINPSDISYINDNNTNDMTIQVQYDIRVYNQSETLQTVVREIANYYDSKYEVLSQGWTPTSKYGNSYSGNGYNAIYSTALAGVTLKPGESAETSVTFKVNDETVKALIGGEKTLFDISEIYTYSVLYGENTRCAENTTAASRNKTGSQYAGVDIDSRPGNAMEGTPPDLQEDDTDKAPIFKLILDENKIVSGTIWEDTDNNASDNQRLGNGTRDGNENGVENVKVELLNAETGEVVKLYPTPGSTSSVDAVTYTDSSGNYNFTGVVVDHYRIRYTYGNDNINGGATKINGHEINARNYKSTIITTEPVKGAINTENEVWHLTQQEDASVAVDDIEERLRIPSLNYKNYNDPHNMTAICPEFKIQVEYTDMQSSDVNEDGSRRGGTFPKNWTVFDFGIIERAREDIVIDKTISNLKITLPNGQVLTEGDPGREKLNYVKAIGLKIKSGHESAVYDRDSFKRGNNKLLSIEMDSELLQGARIDITYAITVTNNSEDDYEYDSSRGGNTEYYYFGTVASPKIQPTIEKVVDYMDPELTCTVGSEATNDINKNNWTQIKPEIDGTTGRVTKTVAEILQADGLGGQISDATKDALNKGNYLIFTTEAFNDVTSGGGSKTIKLFASKLIGNQAEEYTYENHAEILQLNGKIARTIDSTDKGEQIKKTYKPGNYVPSVDSLSKNADIDRTEAGLHEQDDDRIIIRITPPTGSTNNIIIYVIALTVGLVIITVGIYFIKKKIIL